MKIYGKIDPQSHPKSFKTEPWGGQGRFIESFLLILGRVEKSLFFDVVLGHPKIEKNRALGRQGSQKSAMAGSTVATLGVKGPRAPRARYY